MLCNKIFTVLGGDSRQGALAARLATRARPVRVWGLPRETLPETIEHFADWREAIGGADAVILPLPALPDGSRVSASPCVSTDAPHITELLELLPDGVFLAGGKFSPAIKQLAEEHGKPLFDYFEIEELQLKNAIPTAEGAVQILMREVPRTVRDLAVAVTGYGRVARALSDLLLAMGARVTVAARKSADLAIAAAHGCQTVPLSGVGSLVQLAEGQAAIFNTVPYWLFSEEVLRRMPAQSLVIDLASAPGGVDANAAAAHGIRVIWALALPGKYAPLTAGEIIADTLLSHMEKEGLL
ncbi:MAG: dipicolinate synthase [Clostridia bacterium]|nr:dipicolinate synthase [Clostridia bacterium]